MFLLTWKHANTNITCMIITKHQFMHSHSYSKYTKQSKTKSISRRIYNDIQGEHKKHSLISSSYKIKTYWNILTKLVATVA